MANSKLHVAKNNKNDEFYTQYADIQNEINAYLEYDENLFKNKTVLLPCDDPEWSNFTKYFALNFEKFGLKKLISTSYAVSNKYQMYGQIDLFDNSDLIKNSPNFDPINDKNKGKIFTLTRKNKKVNIDDLKWEYLEGDGDFRSEEVKKLRDESDFIITNPPFSLFREFVSWIIETNKKFTIIGSKNSITYKGIFPLIKNNKIWLGNGFNNGNAFFKIPRSSNLNFAKGVLESESSIVKFRNCSWFTNIEHGRRHQPLTLMTKADNIKFSKHKEIKNIGYQKYDNYDAIDVPFVDAIPSDYDGVMGVPITFLDKYCPEQFEIVSFRKGEDGKDLVFTRERERVQPYFRILVSTSIAGMIKNAEGKINGKITYARITIRKIQDK